MGSVGVSLVRIDEVHAIAAARIEAALKSAAVAQSVKHPVADEDQRHHREKRYDIDESAVLEIVLCLPADRRAQAMKLEFLRSKLRQLRMPSFLLGRRQVAVFLTDLYVCDQIHLSQHSRAVIGGEPASARPADILTFMVR